MQKNKCGGYRVLLSAAMGSFLLSTCLSCCFLFVPFVFQSVGMFTPMWASNATCDSIGLVYSCCVGEYKDRCEISNGVKELDIRALGLHATSFAIMFFTVFCLCCGQFCDDDNESCYGNGMTCCLLYPVAGLFSVIGCIIVAAQYSTSHLGYSFSLCLTSGCLVILLTIIGCLFMVYGHYKHDNHPTIRSSFVQPSGDHGNEVGGIAPYDNSEVHAQSEVQQASVKHTVAVQDTETGGVLVYVRRNRLTRLIPTVKNN